jgi:hypothetical protein
MVGGDSCNRSSQQDPGFGTRRFIGVFAIFSVVASGQNEAQNEAIDLSCQFIPNQVR